MDTMRRSGRSAAGQRVTVDRVLRLLRKHDFAILSTVDGAGRPHSAGVNYGVSRPDGDLALYVRHIIAQTDLPYIRPHDLRHTFATSLLRMGENAKTVSEMLGHSSVRITLEIYAHVQPDMQSDAIAKLEAMMRAARGEPTDIETRRAEKSE